MELSCSYGTLDVLTAFGLSKNDQFKCKDIAKSETPEEFMQEGCSAKDDLVAKASRSETGENKFEEYFNKYCKSRVSCRIPLDFDSSGTSTIESQPTGQKSDEQKALEEWK